MTILDISDVKILPGSMLRVVTGQSNVWIYCYTENPEDLAEYSWTKINSNSSSIVSTGQVYVIQTATIEDGGTYICTASNSVGNSSGSVDISVQYKPLAPVLVHVDCRSTEAYVIWTSPSTNSINNVHHSLQLSENKNVFLNASFEKMNRTNDIEINTYKVTNLKPGSVYIFRVLSSNHNGIALSNNHSCGTDPERMEDTNKGCPTEQIIGGTLGGAVLTIFSVVVAYALCKYRKERKNEDKNKETMDRKNVIISREDHHYLGISNTETTDTNVYEKIKDSNKAENRVQYLELIDVPEVDKKNDRDKTQGNESGYSNIT
ncbi:titin-like isoform X2 [Saccostrea cucullata]|uniref:titin-like isoform X2 n=1 Tax=Saccostrea cuccullata TaxID=36930 RepID=UPI002ED0E901